MNVSDHLGVPFQFDPAVDDPEDVAEKVIAEYVEAARALLLDIDLANGILDQLTNQVTLRLASVSVHLSKADRAAIFAGFYWTDPHIPSVGIARGLKVTPKPILSGFNCLMCGLVIKANTRHHFRQLRTSFIHKDPQDRNLYCAECVSKAESALARRQTERQTELRAMRYADYLQSPEWHNTRIAALTRANFRCQICSAKRGTLDVHHNTYERRGREADEDVIVLCRECHSRHHHKLPEEQQ